MQRGQIQSPYRYAKLDAVLLLLLSVSSGHKLAACLSLSSSGSWAMAGQSAQELAQAAAGALAFSCRMRARNVVPVQA